MLKYIVIIVLLLLAELFYFRIACKFNIIDKLPNPSPRHRTIVLRGGGIIFVIAVWLWCLFFEFEYPWFLAGVTLVSGISFADDIKSLHYSVRLAVQFVSMGLLVLQLSYSVGDEMCFTNNCFIEYGMFVVALVVCVGATNIYNFMDGINGITAGYSFAVLLPLLLMNRKIGFMSDSFLVVVLLGVIVFAFFNFRPAGKAKCFAGDVGSIGIAYILLFAIGMIIVKTGDVTWLLLLLVYGVDGCLTICHRIMLHENLTESHHKHVYDLMTNELKMGHLQVSVIYMLLQTTISMIFIYFIPKNVAAHWIYLVCVLAILVAVYILFMKKYYHFHAENSKG